MGRCQRYFQYDPTEFDNFQTQIANMYKSAKPISPNTKRPPLLVEGPGEALQRRCGRTFRQAHEDSRDFLFLDNFYDPRNGEGRGVSSLYIRASVFFAFFGSYTPGKRTEEGSHAQQQCSSPLAPVMDLALSEAGPQETVSSQPNQHLDMETSQEMSDTPDIGNDNEPPGYSSVRPGSPYDQITEVRIVHCLL